MTCARRDVLERIVNAYRSRDIAADVLSARNKAHRDVVGGLRSTTIAGRELTHAQTIHAAAVSELADAVAALTCQ